MEEVLATGKYFYERDYLPVIQGVYGDPRLESVRSTFNQVTEGLDERVKAQFGEELEVEKLSLDVITTSSVSIGVRYSSVMAVLPDGSC